MVCELWEFRCRSGGCVQSNARCDGERQCGDGSDEKGCHQYSEISGYKIGTQSPTGSGCGEGLFQCSSGQCIFSEWLCDHESDCEDGSDEDTCSYHNPQLPYARGVPTSTIAMVTGIICLIFIALSLASVYFMYRRRKLHLCQHHHHHHHDRPSSNSSPPTSTTEVGVGEHWPGLLYDLPPGALLREPPPRYTSRQNLTATNRGFVSEHPGLSPPPYTPPGTTPGPAFEFSMELPPRYTVHDVSEHSRPAPSDMVVNVPQCSTTLHALSSTNTNTEENTHLMQDASEDCTETPLALAPVRHPRRQISERSTTPDVDINKDSLGVRSPSKKTVTQGKPENTQSGATEDSSSGSHSANGSAAENDESGSQMAKWSSLPVLRKTNKVLSVSARSEHDIECHMQQNHNDIEEASTSMTSSRERMTSLELEHKVQSQSVPNLR